MDELASLAKQLATVQAAASVYKLSEPNVVEVVQKLKELGLIEVLFTTNGKEYVTPKQLSNEVEDELLAHGGRVNLTDLPTLLNIDLTHIQRAVDGILKKDGTLQLFQGELIAEYYQDSLAEEIEQALQGAGKITVGELAVQHNLTADFVAKLVEARLGALIHAKLSGGTLYTAAYFARHTARVRGVLSALSGPASLPQLLREHAFVESLFYECVGELVGSGRVPSALTPSEKTLAHPLSGTCSSA